jgi:prolyl 4-hydroxylase
LAFAGGFGAGKSSPTKSKKSKGKQRKTGLSELSTIPPPPKSTLEKTESKLDKWGLPVATEEDLFPLMPPGTELLPMDSSKHYSLEEIQKFLKDHLDLKLDRFFDDRGVEKGSNDRTPMKLRLLHESPPVLAIDNYFTEKECLQVKTAADSAHQVNSATFPGSLSTRTSTSWFCNFSDVPVLLSKANQILNIPLETMEEPQIVRYKKGQEFSWHYDEVPSPQLNNGGQRLATLLVYLNDLSDGCGGGTTFRDLQLDSKPLVMQPKCGSALLFFPAFRDGRPDDRTLHKSEVMDFKDEKWIVQMWVHAKSYQAVLPVGNSNEAARDAMGQMSRNLGYI